MPRMSSRTPLKTIRGRFGEVAKASAISLASWKVTRSLAALAERANVARCWMTICQEVSYNSHNR